MPGGLSVHAACWCVPYAARLGRGCVARDAEFCAGTVGSGLRQMSLQMLCELMAAGATCLECELQL